jgi:phospholipid-binding lipoprotein MlaA
MKDITMSIRAVLLVILLASGSLLGGCSTAPIVEGDAIEPPIYSADDVLVPGTEYAGQIYDPWQGFNRAMYRFNYGFDKYVFLPAVSAYQWVTPEFFQDRFHDFFNTWRDLNTLMNSILQGSPEKTGQTAGRMAINLTLGLLGFFDWATPMGIPKPVEDFGQTLGRWGVGSGPYLVLPILGPSSVRDGTGTLVDSLVRWQVREQVVDLKPWQSWTWSILDALDIRAHVAFRYYKTGSPFEYEWVRLLYSTKRKLDIEK